MKRIILLLFAFLSISQAQAQSDKGYIGINFGVGLPIGDTNDAIENGFELGLVNLGLRFNEAFGVVFSLGESTHNLSGISEVKAEFNYYSFGPMISIGQIDFSPQYAFVNSVYEGNGEEFDIDCKGVIIGITHNFPLTPVWSFATNFDYLSFNPSKSELSDLGIGDNRSNYIKLSAGIRYVL